MADSSRKRAPVATVLEKCDALLGFSLGMNFRAVEPLLPERQVEAQ